MTFVKFFVVAAVVLINIAEIKAHGRLVNPVHRGSAFKEGFDVPENWSDNENWCGNFQTQHLENGGRCGVCGDNFADKQPRDNENGGKYGRGIIVKKYKTGSAIDVMVDLSANHEGFFKFALCPLTEPLELETEECFDAHHLKLTNGEYKYVPDPETKGNITIGLQLPEDFSCEHCVMRWHYTVGNTWGFCSDGTEARGCGPQETFRTCSDIAIE